MVTGRSLCVSESQETKAIECLTLPVSAQNGQLRAPAALLSLPCTRHPARRGGGHRMSATGSSGLRGLDASLGTEG